MCGRTACTVREGGTGEVEAQARWTTCTRRETAGTEPIRRTGHTEPVPYFTTVGITGGSRGARADNGAPLSPTLIRGETRKCVPRFPGSLLDHGDGLDTPQQRFCLAQPDVGEERSGREHDAWDNDSHLPKPGGECVT